MALDVGPGISEDAREFGTRESRRRVLRMDPGERAWLETQRRKLETGEWTYSGTPKRQPSEGSIDPGQAAAVPASIDDVMAAQASRSRTDAQSLMRQVNRIDGKALGGWRGSAWRIASVPATYQPIVSDLLNRVSADRYQSGWVLTDDVYYGDSLKTQGLLPREWVTSRGFEWWDVSGRHRNRECVALLDEHAERVRYVRVPLDEIHDTDARRPTFHFLIFFDDGVRCVTDDHAEHRFKTPDAITGYIAKYLAAMSLNNP
jgi:hypothetical protein